jgi:hypothetical protein
MALQKTMKNRCASERGAKSTPLTLPQIEVLWEHSGKKKRRDFHRAA